MIFFSAMNELLSVIFTKYIPLGESEISIVLKLFSILVSKILEPIKL